MEGHGAIMQLQEWHMGQIVLLFGLLPLTTTKLYQIILYGWIGNLLVLPTFIAFLDDYNRPHSSLNPLHLLVCRLEKITGEDVRISKLFIHVAVFQV